MTTQTIPISGMHCNGCVRSVTNALKNVEGVSDAEVSLANEQALISFDKDQVTIEALRKAVEAAGYQIPQPIAL
jgi:copper chaperone